MMSALRGMRSGLNDNVVAPQVNVQVNTLPGETAEVTQRPRSDGGVDIQVQVRKMVESVVEEQISGRGRIARSFERAYGVRRQTV
ncbi:hypothetical protein [Ancylobacter moscoviensis]|nr:hypothetical protein [Ancylobacter moscoviensis]